MNTDGLWKADKTLTGSSGKILTGASHSTITDATAIKEALKGATIKGTTGIYYRQGQFNEKQEQKDVNIVWKAAEKGEAD